METSASLPAPENETPDQRDIRLNKDVAAFSYVWIISVVVFAGRRDSPFIQYHAKQALILFLMSIPVAIIPYLGRYLVFIVPAGMLLGFINAAQGRREDVPFVGKLASGELKPQDILKEIKPYWDTLLAVLKQILKKPANHAPKKDAPGKPVPAAEPTPLIPTIPPVQPTPLTPTNPPVEPTPLVPESGTPLGNSLSKP